MQRKSLLKKNARVNIYSREPAPNRMKAALRRHLPCALSSIQGTLVTGEERRQSDSRGRADCLRSRRGGRTCCPRAAAQSLGHGGAKPRPPGDAPGRGRRPDEGGTPAERTATLAGTRDGTGPGQSPARSEQERSLGPAVRRGPAQSWGQTGNDPDTRMHIVPSFPEA